MTKLVNKFMAQLKRALLMSIGLIFVGLTPFAAADDHQESYSFVSIKGLIEQEIGRIIIPQIYAKMGIDVSIFPMPGERAQYEATTGEKDGEIMRIFTYGEANTTVVRVSTPYYYLETMAFVKQDSDVKLSSKEDLKNYKLLKVRGVKHTDNITEGLNNVNTVNSTEQMMQSLSAGRADVALTNTVDGLLILDELGITDIVPIDKPLAVLDLYHYIHEDHAELADRVNEVIMSMKESGELQEIIKKAEAQIINNS